MKLSEAANRVIELARKVYDYYDVEMPKFHPHYPLAAMDEEDPPAPPEERELRDFLAGLPEETIYQLILLMYVGQGEFDVDDLAGTYETLKNTFEKPQYAISQMMEKATLADYLSDGLAELKKHRADVDKLLSKRQKARKS